MHELKLMGKKKKNGKEKADRKSGKSAKIIAPQQPAATAAATLPQSTAGLIKPERRQRGRPRKVPLGSVVPVNEEESVNHMKGIVKVLLRSLKDRNKPLATANNGFTRGLKPDAIIAGFRHEGQLMFAVKFKNRKLPELISSRELKLRAPSLLIQYYVTHLEYTYNESNE